MQMQGWCKFVNLAKADMSKCVLNLKMRYILLEWIAFILQMRQPKRENNLKTIKDSWQQRKNRSKEDRTAFSYVKFFLSC